MNDRLWFIPNQQPRQQALFLNSAVLYGDINWQQQQNDEEAYCYYYQQSDFKQSQQHFADNELQRKAKQFKTTGEKNSGEEENMPLDKAVAGA